MIGYFNSVLTSDENWLFGFGIPFVLNQETLLLYTFLWLQWEETGENTIIKMMITTMVEGKLVLIKNQIDNGKYVI